MMYKKAGKLSEKTRSAHAGKAPKPGAATGPAAARTRGGGGGTAAAKAKGISDTQADAVSTMQRLMSDLSVQLQKPEVLEKAVDSIKGTVDAASLKSQAQSWGRTGRGRLTPADGVWGPNTKGSLERIKKFVADAKIAGVMIQEGQGTRPYQEMKDDAITKMANDNIANLARLFTALGLEAPASAKGKAGVVLDQVGPVLTEEAAKSETPLNDPHRGDVMVTVGHLRSFDRFFMLIQQLSFTECRALEEGDREIAERASRRKKERGPRRPERRERKIDVGYAIDADAEYDFQKLAEEVLERSIWKLAVPTGKLDDVSDAEPAKAEEDKPVRSPGAAGAAEGAAEASRKAEIEGAYEEMGAGKDPWAKDEAKPTGAQWHCFYTIDDMLWWFYNRSMSVWRQLYTASQEARPHPLKEGAVTKDDLRAAQAYHAAINELWKQWSALKRAVLGMVDPDEPKVTRDMIFRAMRSRGGPGAGRRRGYPGGPGGGGYTIPGGREETDRRAQGPIQPSMPLEDLLSQGFGMREWEGRLRDLTLGGRLPDINETTWRRDWKHVARTNVAGETPRERLQNFPKWAWAVHEAIRELYEEWRYEYGGQVPTGIVTRQDREWANWGRLIEMAINRARRQMPRAIARVEGLGEE